MLLRRNGGGLEQKQEGSAQRPFSSNTKYTDIQNHKYTNTNTEMEEAKEESVQRKVYTQVVD